MRHTSVVFDKYGIDPLKDKLALNIHHINRYDLITVSEDLEHRADLISALQYDRSDLDFIILEYNDLGHESEIVKGMDLKLPDLTQALYVIALTKKPSVNTLQATV